MSARYPNVSIIILTYNGLRFIDGLMTSLRDQSYPRDRMEIIVVDNGSDDGTADYIKTKFPDIDCLALDSNLGYSAGNNVGYAHVRHDLIAFLNQDTLCHRTWLEGLVNRMQFDTQLVACAANIIPADPGDTVRINLSAAIETLTYCDLSSFGYGRYYCKNIAYTDTLLVSGCAFIIRSEIVEQLGYLFDERIRMYAEDTDLSLRIFNLGERVGAVRDAIVFHLHGSDFKPGSAGLRKATRAIMNRVFTFMRNMSKHDFILFFPLMTIGSGGKIFQLNMPIYKKVLMFAPFSIVSASIMVVTLITNIDLLLKKSRQSSLVTLKTLLRQARK